MNAETYTFKLALEWAMINKLSQIDRFDGEWKTIEKREGYSLSQLKSIATVRSVGASTRIEGSKISNEDVEILIKNLNISKLIERDQQEVAGYFETLEIITDSFENIQISESDIKNLHNILMKYNEKDGWHRGDYKQHANVVEATNYDGSKYIIFQTTAPGIETEDSMRNIIKWYNTENTIHPIIKIALFNYEFLSIHPFQDGNGRLSRLLTTLLLLKSGYTWIQYISFEHEIENRKVEYYNTLMNCQRQRPGEDIQPWAYFFLDCINSIQKILIEKLKSSGTNPELTKVENRVFNFIENHPSCKSSEIAEGIDIPLPTIKKLLATMVDRSLLIKKGIGKGTCYYINE
ncbi:MAG: Fic family protein [Sphingobacteriales bacterium]|nr:Fic family protein [Sphingobacteriales bacterium]